MTTQPQFQFDTSGEVNIGPGNWPDGRRGRTATVTFSFPDLSPFVQGYVEAMLTDVDLVGQWLDTVDKFRAPAFSDLAPETLARIMEDCERVSHYLRGGEFWKWRQAGKLFDFPPLTPYLGDDGKVYLRDL